MTACAKALCRVMPLGSFSHSLLSHHSCFWISAKPLIPWDPKAFAGEISPFSVPGPTWMVGGKGWCRDFTSPSPPPWPHIQVILPSATGTAGCWGDHAAHGHNARGCWWHCLQRGSGFDKGGWGSSYGPAHPATNMLLPAP